jgi:hypothetical protein
LTILVAEDSVRAIFPIILIVAVAVISFALVLGLSLGIGWALTLFLPFSLFEATLVGGLAAGITIAIWRTILYAAPPFPLESEPVEDEPDSIPESRFWRTGEDRTWENWFRYTFANTIYDDILDAPRWPTQMNETQLQETAIHLADITVDGLKTKSPRTKRLSVTKGLLKQDMLKIGHPLYDDHILTAATAAINEELISLDEELREVMREGLWDEPAEVW